MNADDNTCDEQHVTGRTERIYPQNYARAVMKHVSVNKSILNDKVSLVIKSKLKQSSRGSI